jgi:hypothetical protein
LLLNGQAVDSGRASNWSIRRWTPGQGAPRIEATLYLPRASQQVITGGAGINEYEAVIVTKSAEIRYRLADGSQAKTVTWDATGRRRALLPGIPGGNQILHLGAGAWQMDLASGTVIPGEAETAIEIRDRENRWSARFDRATGITTLVDQANAQPIARFEGLIPREFDSTGTALLLSDANRLRVIHLGTEGVVSEHALPMDLMRPTSPFGTSVGRLWRSTWDVRLLPGGRSLAVAGPDGIQLINSRSGAVLGHLQVWDNGDWLISTQTGLWTGSAGAGQRLLGADRAAIDQLRQPDQVRAALNAWLELSAVSPQAAAAAVAPAPVPELREGPLELRRPGQPAPAQASSTKASGADEF